jgi:hypothetical protein
VASGGFIWLEIGHAELVQRAALFSGSWSLPGRCLSCYITRLDINEDQLTLTIHATGNLAGCVECDLGTGSGTFAGEPFTVTVSNGYSAFVFTVTMILNNTKNTELKVSYNYSSNHDMFTAIFNKTGG